MKNKFTRQIILMITIIVFVVLILTTSYAYFATNTSIDNVANINVNISNGNTMIYTDSSSCEFVLNPSSMTELQSTNEAIVNTNCALNITLSGEPGVKCYYDLVLREESTAVNENYVPYTPSPGIGVAYEFEFTGTITKEFSDTTGDNSNIYTSYYSNGNENISALGNELQMNVLTSGLLRGDNDETANGIIARGVIGINEAGVPVVHTYTFNEKWYNIDVPQEIHSGKKYSYKLVAENILC